MKFTATLACAALALTSPAFAAPVFRITELYIGVNGPDGTNDWFELTNFGDMPGSTAGLYADDSSNNPTLAGALSDVTIAPGASAVFLMEGVEADVANFAAVWGPGISVGLVPGSGLGLGAGGDGVNLFTGNVAGSTRIATVSYGSGFEDTFTLDFVAGAAVKSSLGVNGAYESNPFVNETIGFPPGPGATVTLVGSPGRIPEPTAVLLAAGALAAVATRRRG